MLIVFSIMRLISEPPGKIVKGEIIYGGNRDLVKCTESEMMKIRGKEISMIFQEPMTSLNPVLRVGKQVSEMILRHEKISRKEAMERTVEMLKMVGIPSPEKRIRDYPHEFSGGQRQRIGIARALSLNPKLIVCDEPVSALDVSIQSQVINLLDNLQKEFDLTYLFIAHDLNVVQHVSDRVVVMYLGRVVETGGSYDLYRTPFHPYTEALLSASPIPNPTATRKRFILEGDVPSPINPPSGCHFNTRCLYVINKCRLEPPPPLEEIIPHRWVRCWRVGELRDV